ncbi:golgin subfamily A member 4-like [Siniperca chuatsi]|uniref:golgin subfamily A member 4-like n=1 Tax=Siniperca chuatsi TaxID=119488 RepID=UPI001CE1250F|nr:golgin subfamily A member 4-like [Siniperca chuatsi]
MAVANPCLQEWDEWKKEMEENRKRRWRERVSRWAKVEVSDEEEQGEDDGEEEEAEDMDNEEEEVSKDEEENETDEKGEEVEQEEMEVREAEEMEEESENEVGRGVKETKKGNEEEDREVVEAHERVHVEEEEKEEENEVEREVKENEEVDEDKEKEVKAEELVEGEEEGENEVEREVKENKELDVEEEKEVTEAEEVEEEEKEVENEVLREVNDYGEVVEKEVMEAEEMEEEQEEGEDEFERDVKVNEEEDRQVRKEEQVDEEIDGKEEHQDQEQIGQYHLAEKFREQMRRIEDENVQQNQESTRQEDKTVNEEEKLSDSAESENEDSELTGSEDECCNFERIKDDNNKQYKDTEELEDADEKSWRNENSILGAGTSKERKEEESEKLTEEEEAVAESWTAQEEEFQDDHKKLQEEESTDDEEAEHSMDEDTDSNDEDVVKIYCKDDYLTDLFCTLTEFRDSSLLTDLTLSTEDGKSFLVHSPVLAAVSSLIRERLSRSNVENYRGEERKDNDTRVGVHMWLVSLGPEVDHVGLEAVVEFAYTGLISRLNKDTVHQIKAVAQTLGVPRVLDLCIEEEEKSTKTGGQEKEEKISAAEQMMISLQSIKQLWMDRVGCDVILEALGGSLHVHRVILAVLSDYFRGMFTLGMRESHQPCVSLPFLLASELEVLIDCSYSGALPLSWRCVFEITSTALQLQYQPALSLCLDFLQQEINPHSCLDVASFAEAYEMVQLLEVADDFVLRQFQKVVCTSKFKDLPAKQLLKYLNSHSLCVSSELVVFKAVVAWIQAKPKKRLKLAKELMKTIHFTLMTFTEFREVQSLNMWSDHNLAEIYEAVFEDFCSNETALQSQCRIYMPKESLVVIGGDQTFEDLGTRSISRELWFGNSLRNHTGIKKALEWRKLGEMPEPARFRHEVTVLKGQLYVFGGKKYYGIRDTLNSVYRYDPLQNSWESLAEMQEKRCSFSVVVLDGKIYAIGGYCDPDYIESVERYCPTANSWSFTCPLDLPLSGHVAKVLQGQIFISGGLSSDYQCLASMFLYHPETGSTYLANMAKPRIYHCMDVLGECLYVAGGITRDDDMTIVDQLACEVYNPVANSWTAFTSLPVPHVGAGSAVLEGKFYVLGGYSQEDYSDTKMVHRYDPTTQRWENMGKMPGPNNDIRASLLCLPPHLRL